MATSETEYISSEGEGKTSTSTPDIVEEKPADPGFGPAPDGGPRAWLVASGSAFILFSTLGYVNSFGVLQQYYEGHLLSDQSPSNISWIGSLSSFLQLSMGAIAGPLFDRYGAWVIRPAAILFIFSMMMTSLCKEYWQFMLAQGVLMGVCIGLLLFPAMAAVMQFFDKKRAAALGLVVSGSSIGGVIFPIALSKMLNGSSLGFGWSIRVVGFIILPVLLYSCLTVRSRLPPRTTSFFLPSAFKQRDFILLIVAEFFMFLGMFTPLFFIPSYAVSRGVDTKLASYLLAILNAASTFGRILPGILADRFGRLNMLGCGGMLTGITIFCMTKAETTAALVVYSIAIGFCSGTIISNGGAAFSVCTKDPRNIGTYMGMGMGLAGVAALIGPPVNGVLVKDFGGYFQASMFSGAMCTFGGLFVFVVKTATPEGILGKV
ncbi:Aspyridones efflux protein apdF [Lachnellula suecica]|uniref:Aspyridones efflux protein apdF n=1 Tax=Lachnellula suecica TaxID=602035 RepID=A0A8T9C691_9HELO|nr:Aspyridones efflux protein apdF [Lachnellula suecica]